jgi:hypothetical protein
MLLRGKGAFLLRDPEQNGVRQTGLPGRKCPPPERREALLKIPPHQEVE